MSTNPYQTPSASVSAPPPPSNLKDAGKGKRFLNALIDGILLNIIQYLFGMMLGASGTVTAETVEAAQSNAVLIFVLSLAVWVGYYILMESSTGATLGKMLTGTRVVDQHGNKPTMAQIVGRSFARLIPFEAFSFLGSGPGGWHDTMSKTRVVLK